MSRLYAYAVSLAIVVAVAWPASWPRGRDSFPLSPYPMFSRRLPTARVSVSYALGLDPGGGRHLIAPKYIANDEVLLAKMMIIRALQRGRAGRTQLCQQIAARVAKVGSGSLSRVDRIRIVTGDHDAVDYLTGRNTVGRERIHITCPVRR